MKKHLLLLNIGIILLSGCSKPTKSINIYEWMVSDTCNEAKIVQNIKTPDNQYIKDNMDTLQWDNYEFIDGISGNLICTMDDEVALLWSWKTPFKKDIYKKIHDIVGRQL